MSVVVDARVVDALADTVFELDADSEMGDIDADFDDEDVELVVAIDETERVFTICVADLSAVRDEEKSHFPRRHR